MKMKKSELKPYKELLLELRSRLRGDVTAMANSALCNSSTGNGGTTSSVPSHIADLGSDTYEQDNTIFLMHSEGETLVQIEAALERIEQRTYGICVECNKVINKLRLKAIPYTAYCVKCASEIQSRND
ncbi:MAG TPA: TraR/DksA family transcriptional regulator [Pirellulaceae bacterium]|nr:TraR/DksA family transcriptional regulator [Pirellulaceae bacterium]HMO92731.1 TraR/DksA family transcriptional regulator [Pirellulaceae bacterium]HMP70283.1 TraR/DksA family transcriptional regulator [Pirellulaceae bacterium]